MLYAAAGLFGLGTVTIAWWGWAAPPAELESTVTAAAHAEAALDSPTPTDDAAASAQSALADARSAWNLNLQRPLFDPPPPPPPAPPTPPPLSVRLQGTIIEPGYSRAIFISATGQTQLCAVGQAAEGGAEVLSIEREVVRVRYQGREMDLRVQTTDDATAEGRRR